MQAEFTELNEFWTNVYGRMTLQYDFNIFTLVMRCIYHPENYNLIMMMHTK